MVRRCQSFVFAPAVSRDSHLSPLFVVCLSIHDRPLGWLPFFHNWAFMNDASASFVNAVVSSKIEVSKEAYE